MSRYGKSIGSCNFDFKGLRFRQRDVRIYLMCYPTLIMKAFSPIVFGKHSRCICRPRSPFNGYVCVCIIPLIGKVSAIRFFRIGSNHTKHYAVFRVDTNTASVW